VLLADHFGWSGDFLESGAEDHCHLNDKYRLNSRVTTIHAAVTARNVEPLFEQAGVPEQFDVLSIDIDGNDYWVWRALSRFTPRVVVIEYNANLALDAPVVMPHDDEHRWDGTDYFGASLAAYCRLGEEKGYVLVHTDRTGANAFFVRAEEAGGLFPPGLVARNEANYDGRGLGHQRDPLRRPFQDPATGTPVDAERTGAS
jgi:hypothetical protein